MKYPKLRELREAFKSIFTKPATTKYPFKAPEIYPRYRGKPEFQDRCIGCHACSEVCPPRAIEVVDDIKNRKRKLMIHFDACITCGECERICTSGEGIKLVPEFALAVYDREELTDTIERELVLCENCRKPIATKEHILWMIEKLKEKSAALFHFQIIHLKELGVAEEVEKKVSLDKRQDLFAILCPKCRHKVIFYDSLGKPQE